MTTINKSLLSKNNFRLLIDKVPNVECFVKTVNIPGLQFSETVAAAGIGLGNEDDAAVAKIYARNAGIELTKY